MGGTRGLSFNKVIIFVPLHFNHAFYDLFLFLVISYCFVHAFKSSLHHPVPCGHLSFPFFSSLFLSLSFSPFNHLKSVCFSLILSVFSGKESLPERFLLFCYTEPLSPWQQLCRMDGIIPAVLSHLKQTKLLAGSLVEGSLLDMLPCEPHLSSPPSDSITHVPRITMLTILVHIITL